MKVFPTRLFDFGGRKVDLERRTISGGTAVSGEEDLIATDGGGRLFAEFSEPDLDDPEVALAWEAIGTLHDDGVDPIIVPLGDATAQMMGDIQTPVGGLPWWEESDFADGETGVSLSADAALRATTLVLAIAFLPGPLRPAQLLSIDHTTKRHRAYRIAEVVAQDTTSATIKIRPPLRELTLADVAVEFNDPKCTMRVDGSMAATRMLGFADAQSVRFVEFPGDVA